MFRFIVLLLIIFSFAGVGRIVCRLLHIKTESFAAEWLLASGFGLIIFWITWLTLGLLQCYSRKSAVMTLALFTVMGAAGLVTRPRLQGSLYAGFIDSWKTAGGFLKFIIGSIVITVFFAICSSSSPPTNIDATTIYLVIVRRFIEAGGIVYLGDVANSNLSLNHELLGVFTMLLDDDILFKWVTVYYNILMLAAVFIIAGRLFDRRAAIVSVFIFIQTPIIISTFSYEKNDILMLYLTLLAVYLYLFYAPSTSRYYLASVLAGVIIGFAGGVKYNAVFNVLILIAIPVLFWNNVPRRTIICSLALLMMCALIGVAPYAIRSYLYNGTIAQINAPDNIGINMPNTSGLQLSWIQATLIKLKERLNAAEFLRFPFLYTLRIDLVRNWFDSPGPVYLLLLPFFGLAAFYRNQNFKRIAIVLVPLYIIFIAAPTPRYALILLVMLAIAGGMIIRELVTWPMGNIIKIAGVAYGVTGMFIAAGYSLPKLKVAVGIESRDQYLQERIQTYPAMRELNRIIEPGDRVFCMSQESYYVPCPHYIGEPTDNLSTDYPNRKNPGELLAFIRSKKCQWIFANEKMLQNRMADNRNPARSYYAAAYSLLKDGEREGLWTAVHAQAGIVIYRLSELIAVRP